MMRFCNVKNLLYVIALIALFCVPLESLFSQNEPKPSVPTGTRPPPSVAPPAVPSVPLTKGPSSNPANPPQKPEKPAFPSYEEFGAPTEFQRPSLLTQAIALAGLSLLPFAIMILSSFMKIVIVLSLLRSALGVQQAPPNQVINGVAFMLSLFVMFPTFSLMYENALVVVNRAKTPESVLSPESSAYIVAIANSAKEPLRDFLKRNSSPKHQAIFYRMAFRNLPEQYRGDLKPDDFLIVVPAYIVSQLKDAFEIGVLIYIPFFVIDLVTSNVLLAMGMMMLSPVTISMPLKLFLLVMLDGWTLLVEGLVNTFR